MSVYKETIKKTVEVTVKVTVTVLVTARNGLITGRSRVGHGGQTVFNGTVTVMVTGRSRDGNGY